MSLDSGHRLGRGEFPQEFGEMEIAGGQAIATGFLDERTG